MFSILTKTRWGLTGLLFISSSLTWSIERENARSIDLSATTINQGRSFSTNSQLHQVFGLNNSNSLTQKSVRIDRTGKTHKRYQQHYKNIPIWGETLNIHAHPTGKIQATGFLIKGLENTNIDKQIEQGPSITGDEALTSVKTQLKHTTENWHISAETIKTVIYVEKQNATMAYLIEYLAEPTDTQIPFKIKSSLQPSRPFFIINANTGKVIKTWEGLNHIEIGSGPGGNEKTGRYEYGTDFSFLDVRQNASTCILENDNVKTVNLNHGTSGSSAYSYSCPENTFQTVNGAYSPLNDAHYFGNVVFNMYQDWLNTAPLTFQLIMRVHYSSNYENATWNGQVMSFGDGASMFYPLVDINVSAHEVSHGFTEQNSGLVYRSESGGMNEAFSDIAGEAAEFYLRGSVDWLVGADITKSLPALRYFEDPALDGRSIGHTDDYYDGMDVHYSSGIYNRAFYLLANSTNWDVQTAFLTFAHANMNYWTANETFINGACGVIDSAYDLNYDFIKVDTAFKTVGIDCGTLPFYDADGDGMDDNWETTYGLDNTDPSDAALDYDSDSLSNLQEYTFRTNPLQADSDSDSLSDYDEVMTHGTNPNLADSDNDGLTDDYEINTSSTNPNNSDSDNDNLDDAREIELGTDANNADTDSDGMNDGWEIESELDPMENDANLDLDGDGLSNAQEFTYGTQANNVDSDNDDLSDYNEVITFSTNPLNSDTDSDNMPDGWETTYSLDPLSDDALLDSDSDGINNIDEFTYGSDPSNAASRPTIIAFDFESGETPEAWFTPEDSDAGWQTDTTNSSEGSSSIRPQIITHNQNAEIEFSDYFKANTFSFFAKTSSEQSFDFLNVYVDDVRVIQLSGNIDWQKYQLEFDDGFHTIRFQYHKDGSVNSAEDTVWVDDVIYVRQDADNDGMPDYWESQHLLDMYNADDAALDNDSDLLTNLQEFTFNTNPNLADTDTDGLTDYQEIFTHQTNPNLNDSDSDGLTDGDEINTHSTNPNNADSDSDGLNDTAEVEIGTNANNPDSDNDGMPDGWEVESQLDPLTNDADLDSDNDGLSNSQEALLGTNANNPDSDSDNLLDFDEVQTHTTNPANPDTDGDAMPDGWEVQYGLDPLTSNANIDSDGDGFSNLDEFNYSTDPSDALSIPSLRFYGFESGGLPINWLIPEEADSGWQVDTSSPHTGTYSARAQTITHNQYAQLEFNDYFEEGSISFKAKISSEDNYDYFNVYIDDTSVLHLSGLIDWQEYSFNVDSGRHTVRFEYRKDGSVNTGSDTVWIDDIQYMQSDSDNDGIPDYWEELYTLNINDPSDATQDIDDDSLSNLEEFIAGTNPLLSDTDNDGLADNIEIDNGLNPTFDDANLDMDNDGLSNIDEIALGTQLDNPDSDSDGMTDGWESNSNLDPFSNDAALDLDRDGLNNLQEMQNDTQPRNSDSDSDGLTDGQEVLELNSNPNNADTDSDGMPDNWEFEHDLLILLNDDGNDYDLDNLSNINEYIHTTNPSNPDSDADGMNDGWEVSNQLNPLDPSDNQLDPDNDGLDNLTEHQLGTNIHSADTDFDGLIDSREVNELNTNPLTPDSDSDGVNDAEDYYPNDPSRTKEEGENKFLGIAPINPYLIFALLLITCSRIRKTSV